MFLGCKAHMVSFYSVVGSAVIMIAQAYVVKPLPSAVCPVWPRPVHNKVRPSMMPNVRGK